MYTKINGETYQVSTNLGVAYELEKIYNKKISEIASSINDFDIKETINVLYVGAKRNQPEIKSQEFEELFMNSEDFGIVDLKKEVIVFLTLMMAKNRPEDEVRAEIEEKFNSAYEEEDLREEDNSKN